MIRAATEDDWPATQAVFAAAGLAAWSHILPAPTLLSLSASERWRPSAGANALVAESGEGVRGFVCIRPSGDEDATPETGEIDAFYTHPSIWGMGVGRALLAAALAQLADSGFREATLWTEQRNDRPLRFYRNAGWSLDGAERRRSFHGTELVELRHRLLLPNARRAKLRGAPTMSIRPYVESDWDAVRTIYDLAKPDEMRGSVDLAAVVPLAEDASHLALFRESQIIVMEDGNETVGFAGHKANYISCVFVHPAHRRRGVATALVRAILSRINGTATLNVGKNNRAARSLYRHLGFVVEKEFVGNFNGHEVDVMTLRHDERDQPSMQGEPRPDLGG